MSEADSLTLDRFLTFVSKKKKRNVDDDRSIEKINREFTVFLLLLQITR